jgi:hypothetical protein
VEREAAEIARVTAATAKRIVCLLKRRGLEVNYGTDEILWHRREARRKPRRQISS